MRNSVKIILAALLFLAIGSVSGPATMACPQADIDVNYYDANGCWQGERIALCSCSVNIFGTITGAHWKHLESTACDSSSSSDIWYEWDGSSWQVVSDPGLPGC
jgi:hypothetical protein